MILYENRPPAGAHGKPHFGADSQRMRSPLPPSWIVPVRISLSSLGSTVLLRSLSISTRAFRTPDPKLPREALQLYLMALEAEKQGMTLKEFIKLLEVRIKAK